ncbi:MAG: acyl-CoA dehydrogenase [Desulfarculus sp.]|nr:MAG: acyl-CoA dehydrogenase [Desulfarculus sp.]
MDYDLSTEQAALREGVRRVLKDAPAPELAGLDAGQLKQALLAWAGRLAPGGFLQACRSGGLPLLLAQEALAAVSPALLLGLAAGPQLLGRLLARYGTPTQQERLLPALEQGRGLGAVALGETGTSPGPDSLQTTAAPQGEGYVLSGSKGSLLGGPLADWLAVAAESPTGLVWCLLPAGAPGLRPGPRTATLGLEGAAFGGLELNGCPVPAEMVIGPLPDRGSLAALQSWEDELLIAAGLGVLARSQQAAAAFAKEHRSGGKPIIAYQEVGFKLAETLTLQQTAQLLAYKAAWALESGDREAGALLACAKVFCCEAAQRVAGEALQVLGRAGFARGNPVEEAYRDAKYLTIAGVSMEISRQHIGEAVLAAY